MPVYKGVVLILILHITTRRLLSLQIPLLSQCAVGSGCPCPILQPLACPAAAAPARGGSPGSQCSTAGQAGFPCLRPLTVLAPCTITAYLHAGIPSTCIILASEGLLTHLPPVTGSGNE